MLNLDANLSLFAHHLSPVPHFPFMLVFHYACSQFVTFLQAMCKQSPLLGGLPSFTL